MRPFTRLLSQLSLALAILAPGAALAEPSAIYLVRHGEKASVGQDPELTPQGQARAQAIAAILARAGITGVFSTPTQRTRQTAQPLAQRIGLEVQLYDPHAPKALVDKVNASFAGACNLTAGGPHCRYPAFPEQCPDVSKSFGMARY